MTSVQTVEATFRRIRELNPKYNAFTALTEERAMREAKEVDARRGRGEKLGPLAGVPYAVKNLYDIEGVVTLAGSKINRDNPPAKRDAFVVRRLRAAGAVLVGACNMEEYAYGFTTENFHYGATRNPRDPTRTAGGSSGGSAAAVAADMVPMALGSDTNGSIRVPAGLCGIFGIKPTFGRLSRRGVFPFVPSLDHAGPFARTVADLAACYDAMQGYDADDPACRERPVEPVSNHLSAGIGNVRIAMAAGSNYDELLSPEAAEAVKLAADTLNVKTKVEVPEFARARAAALLITFAEASSLQLPTMRKRPADYDPATRDRFLAGALIPAEWVLFAHRFRAWYREAWRTVFENADVVIAAATAFVAQPLGQDAIQLNGKQVPLRPAYGLLTAPLSFLGVPVVTVPMKHKGPLPMGVQVIAAPWREDLAFRVAAQLERAGATSV
jgi:aspartyl-tRNA(Asn)/glutamyl-tRNA(Gln) amidotransferase subunit A